MGWYPPPQEEEIDLMEYWRVIWKRKMMILSVTVAAALVSIVVLLRVTPIYRAEVLLAPVTGEESKGRVASLGGLGGLAAMAGMALPGGGRTEENLAILKSREFIWKFIKDNKLMPVLFEDGWDPEKKRWKEDDPEKQPSQWAAYRAFSGVINVNNDKKTGLVTFSVEWKDAGLAANWANELARRLNAYLREQATARSEANLEYLRQALMQTQISDMRQTLFELIASEQKKAMLANAQEEFAFRVLDRAVEPDMKVKSKRSQIVILSTLFAGFLAVFAAFILESIERRKREKEAKG